MSRASIEVLEWYGQAPDREEIENTVQAALDDGWTLTDKDYRVGTHYPPEEKSDEFQPEEHHVLILWFYK